ncbi:mandelate racemase/muconate lactonizing enzyme family protein [Rhodocytophaga rosea]|uniref:Mandelate racemase/muconate lactonizing enzyme family protein n=1 Tax=Rhodocytophaga rosea TaxID=2704465 RepID=A0A6C0GF41_9BACT|nr:mandelate racemase/muconate lactonizing enzyme family protein [Rhodocytophaga rosea]QHT66424.1 mandelate racemase/muconate lactonizing enzyme family protein [Rhodocytophaga rosea]
MNRRNLLKSAGALAALSTIRVQSLTQTPAHPDLKTIKITQTNSDFEREKLIRPFGFKGGYLTELWQTIVRLESQTGKSGIGLGTQSVLYGDPDLFAAHSEAGGNALKYALTEKVLHLVKQTQFTTPIELLEKIMPEVIATGKRITGKSDLNPIFVYISLVAIDNAAWLIYATENNFTSFDQMVPAQYSKALSARNNKIAIMYQVPYGMPIEELKKAAEDGYFVFKLKSGAPGTQSEMLQKDCERLTQIHTTLKGFHTSQMNNGKLIYTIDPNARYDKKETFQRYLDHAKKIGAIDQILFAEEPLNEKSEENVKDLGILIAGDESVHDEATALRRLEQGYGALVLKGIAKTLSFSMKVAKLAQERNIPCLCADLTVNPILVDWHKNLAARLSPFPGIGMGLMETNGDAQYRNWPTMMGYNPAGTASWNIRKNGVFELKDEFYQRSAGIFEPSVHYQEIFRKS